jgi:uncharacterized protein YbjT (DUF2867 family)
LLIEVGREIIDALVAMKKHEITIFSRNVSGDQYDTEAVQKPAFDGNAPGVTWRAVNYDNKSELIEALRGIHTVLSFIQLLADPENTAQKNLIDAAIAAGVKRFAPSQWGR